MFKPKYFGVTLCLNFKEEQTKKFSALSIQNLLDAMEEFIEELGASADGLTYFIFCQLPLMQIAVYSIA